MTVERAVDPAIVGALYEMYAAAFGPMRTRAAARHLLSEAEFAAEMADERIEKYLVRTDDGEPLALTTVTRDLTAVPWISPEFYLDRYPEHAARGALYYLGYALVRPGRNTYRVGTSMLNLIMDRIAEEGAVCVYDLCAYNGRRAMGRFAAALSRGRGATVETVDVQTYYSITFDAPPTGPGQETVVPSRPPTP